MYLKQGIYRHKMIDKDQFVYHDGTEIIKCPIDYEFDHVTITCNQ